jgi:hypothetical protein
MQRGYDPGIQPERTAEGSLQGGVTFAGAGARWRTLATGGSERMISTGAGFALSVKSSPRVSTTFASPARGSTDFRGAAFAGLGSFASPAGRSRTPVAAVVPGRCGGDALLSSVSPAVGSGIAADPCVGGSTRARMCAVVVVWASSTGPAVGTGPSNDEEPPCTLCLTPPITWVRTTAAARIDPRR